MAVDIIFAFQKSDQNGTLNGDFTNRFSRANLDFIIFPQIALRLTGQSEGNQVDNSIQAFSNRRIFNSYGAGLTYRKSATNFLSVSFNKVDSDLDEDDNENFIGVDFAWALSPRTSLQGNFNRRFFGETGSFDFSYNVRRARANIRYSEDVTSNSQLIGNTQSLGIFVCPAGQTNIGDCFLPNSLDTQLNAGQQLVQFNTQNFEINDNVFIRRALNAQYGYSFSRLNITLFSTFSEETFLDQDAARRTYSGGVRLGYDFGSRTQLNANITYADILGRGQGGQNTFFQAGESQNLNASFGINTDVSRNGTVSANITFIDQSGDLGGGGFGNIGGLGNQGGDFTERRITIGFSYALNRNQGNQNQAN